MTMRAWLARQQLRAAAKLLDKKILNEFQYSFLAIKLGYQMMGRPLGDGDKVDYYSLGAQMMTFLASDSTEASIRRSFEVYGPYNAATVTVKADRDGFSWSSSAESAARTAQLQLRVWNRAAFRVQEWWLEQTRIFPTWSAILAALALLVVGAVIGHFLK